MWKCKKCGAEDSIIAEGYEKNWVRWGIDENGDVDSKITEENEETIIDYYECDECKCQSRELEDIAVRED